MMRSKSQFWIRFTAARADRNVQSFLGDKQIKREIYVKGRLVNLVA